MNEEKQKIHVPENYSKPLTHHSHAGPVLAVLVLLLLLVFGGLYIWGRMLQTEIPQPESPLPPNNEPETPRSQADVQILDTVSSSDDLGAIESDLQSTNFGDIDTDLEIIGNELDTALQAQQ